MTAKKLKKPPRISRSVIVSPIRIHAARAAKTDSVLRSSETAVGVVCCCPTIWKV